MKKILLTAAAVAMMAFSSLAEQVSITWGNQGFADLEKMSAVTSGDVTIDFSAGTHSLIPTYYSADKAIRLYYGDASHKNEFSVSVPDGYKIDEIINVSPSQLYLLNATASTGTIEGTDATSTWTPTVDTRKVTFVITKTSRLKMTTVVFSKVGVETPDDPSESFDYGFSYASWGIDNNYDYTYNCETNSFSTNITFTDLPSGVAIDSTMLPLKWIRETDGESVNVDVRNYLGSIMMITESATWPADPFGTWVCVLPKGLFTSGDSQSEEKVIKLNWVNPYADNPRPEFEVTRFSFFNTPNSFNNREGQPNGAPATMMYTLWKTVEGGENMMDWATDPKTIINLNSNKGFVINTTQDEWIQCFIAEVKRKDGQGEVEVWNQETVQEIYGYGVVCKNYVGASASDCEAYQHPLLGCGGNEDSREYIQGVDYTLDIWFYDSMQSRSIDTPEHPLAIGSYHIEFQGGTAPYPYSETVSLVSIDPVPVNAVELGLPAGSEPGEVTAVNQPITVTWSAPVKMTAKYPLGSGAGLTSVSSCTSNADGTVWTVIPGAQCISTGEGGYQEQFVIDLQAIDASGRYVKGNVGEKANTMFAPEFKYVDKSTGVNAIEVSQDDSAYYDLNGCKVKNPVRGLYIKVKDGKASKVIIK